MPDGVGITFADLLPPQTLTGMGMNTFRIPIMMYALFRCTGDLGRIQDLGTLTRSFG